MYEAGKHEYKTFVDLIAYLDSKGIKEAKFKPLLLIDYFVEFGNQRELLYIADMWDFLKQGTAKSIKRESVDKNPTLKKIILKYTTHTRKDGSEAASYTFTSPEAVMQCLYDCEAEIRNAKMNDLEIRVKIQNSLDILGYCDVQTGRESDRRKLLITDIFPLKNNGALWAYRLSTKSLGSGKIARVTVRADVYNRCPINKGDIIYAAKLYKNKAGYWYISDYSIEM